jgi:hypothetical protein
VLVGAGGDAGGGARQQHRVDGEEDGGGRYRVGRPMNGSGRWWLLGQASTKVKDGNNTKAQAGVRLLASRNDAAYGGRGEGRCWAEIAPLG